MVDLVAAAAGVLKGECVSPCSSYTQPMVWCRPLAYVYLRDSVGTTGDGLLAGLAVPDTDGVTLDGDLSAEGAGVAGVLGDFHLQGMSILLETWGGRNSIPSSPAYGARHHIY